MEFLRTTHLLVIMPMLFRLFNVFIITVLWITIASVSAQELRYRSDVITREDGLSNSSVSCIMKDSYGFLWLGTWNGLNRYDGYEMTVFQADRKDSASISNSNINSIYEDAQGLLWIGTDNGLNAYDPVSGKFTRYFLQKGDNSGQPNNQINGITQDEAGMIWTGSQGHGLLQLNKSSGIFSRHINPYSDRSNNVICLLADNQNENTIWVGTADGFFKFDQSTGYFQRISEGVSDPSFSVQVMQQDPLGNIYLGTWGNGLVKYNRKLNKLTPCCTEQDDQYAIHQSVIRAMSFDGRGNLTFIVRDKGLMNYCLSTGRISMWNTNEMNNDLNNKAVTTMCADSLGIIWIGTVYDGVIKIVSLINSFDHYNPADIVPGMRGGGVTAILEDSEGYLWMGTRFGGLIRINRKSKEYTVYRHEPAKNEGLSSNNIMSLTEIRDEDSWTIWIGTDGGGLNCMDPVSGKITVYKKEGHNSNGPGSNSVSSILRYDRDHLLIGTRDRNLGEGLDVFNLRTRKFVNMRFDPSDSTSLGSNHIIKLFKDRTGTIWVGTRNGGLNKFVVKNINGLNQGEIGYFIRYMHDPSDPASINDNTVYAIHDDADNNLWIGTNGGGLTKLNYHTGKFTGSSTHTYLNDYLIFGILADDHGTLWISTSRGIVTLNPNSDEIHIFDEYDGLQENAFVHGSYFKSESGEMFFGGIKGCNSFHPDSIRLNILVPEIAITSLELSGKKGKIPVTALTGKSVMASKTVKTPYYQNNFSISFSALDYRMPVRNRYKFILEGYDDNWIETDAKRRYVNYTNLSPGKYIFRVIGSNSHDVWNHQGTSVTIIIRPPFWRTTAFKLLLLLLLIGAMVFLFYFILQKYQREKRQVELEAQSMLQDERKQLRTLIDNTHDLIFIKDKQSRFTVANKKVAQVMGTTPENLIGKTDFDFYSIDLAQAFYNDEKKILETGIPMINHEEPALDENGDRIILSTTKVPVKNKKGDIIGIVGICRNITHLKRIETQLRKKSEDLQETNRLLETRQKEILMQSEALAEQTQRLLVINAELERLNRTKDKFFSIIAHDLRNPFNAIIGFCELLRNDFHEMDTEQKMEVLELINVSSQTAYNLLENLLQWARTQTDKIKFSPENFDLTEMADTVIDLLCGTADKKGVILKNDVPPNTLVYADKNMINTVLRNLVSNAIKFSNAGGTILITATKTNDEMEVHVIDEGVGMDRESLNKLFRIDTYHSTSGTRGESGTGLGLIICKEFVEKNHGRIKANSVEGEGTTLTFTLHPARTKEKVIVND